jgi:hypothetical protein
MKPSKKKNKPSDERTKELQSQKEDIKFLKVCMDSIKEGMDEQQEELKEMISKQGTEHKNTLERLNNTLHNIITEKGQEKNAREELNSEDTIKLNRIIIMERLDKIAHVALPISSKEVQGLSLFGNTSNLGFQYIL